MSNHEKSTHTKGDLVEAGIKTAENVIPARELVIENEDAEFVFDKAMERKIMWKCDLHLLPPLSILFIITFIDRTNIANAKIEGMTTDLRMGNTDYNKALWILNIPYICLALPSNILMKKGFMKPSIYLSGLMFCWAVCVIGMGVTKSFKGILACRFLMGCFEAGFVPGCAYLISRYYKRKDFSARYAVFFSAAVLAGAFGGFLAYAIEHMDGVGGYSGWRWIFIIEGLMTVATTIIGLLFIPNYPKHSNFLLPKEKQYMLNMLKLDSGPSRPDHYNLTVMKECLFDPKIWLGMIAYFGADTAASSIVSFQPTILKSLGYTNAQAQIHTVPVYIVALAILNICAFFSGYLRHRYGFVVFGACLGVIGWAVELTVPITSVAARYCGMFAIASSAYVQMPLIVAWISNNMGGNAKAAFGTGFVIGIGNCGNLVSSNIFITTETPRFRTGFRVGLALTCVGIAASTALELLMFHQNRRRESGKENEKLELCEDALGDLGDNHPNFRYML